MMKFKVVKGGTLMLAIAIIILISVICVIAISYFDGDESSEPPIAAMAGALPLSPGAQPAENEHTDDITTIRTQIIAAPEPYVGRVLIYHTHTHEAYTPEYPGEYAELEQWRTDDNSHNVVRVGEELAARLTRLGFEVVHDKTDHEGDDLATAYSRSLETLEKYDTSEFDLLIDLHRDAYSEGVALTCGVRGKNAARLMALIGVGENFNDRPDYQANYAFAQQLTALININNPGLCRDVLVKNGRYNQHVGAPAILIEVGNNKNTLSEALAAVPPLAEAIHAALRSPAAGEIITVSGDN